MKVASSALPSSAIIFFLIVADWRGLFTNKCVMYAHTTLTKVINALNVLHNIDVLQFSYLSEGFCLSKQLKGESQKECPGHICPYNQKEHA